MGRPRRRTPGWYVRARVSDSMASFLPRELLDGPWASREGAERRAAEIEAARAGRAVCEIVRVAEDGFTVLQEEK